MGGKKDLDLGFEILLIQLKLLEFSSCWDFAQENEGFYTSYREKKRKLQRKTKDVGYLRI